VGDRGGYDHPENQRQPNPQHEASSRPVSLSLILRFRSHWSQLPTAATDGRWPKSMTYPGRSGSLRVGGPALGELTLDARPIFVILVRVSGLASFAPRM
jgi:hypothetical protein